ncbi:DUF11 domain-containing protein [Lutibacter sp. B1]|uniref:DUF11 domain-containing protein n=1 Tax=Lutibacter sp. B1 TaxID=2725996 RepID=UPI00145733B7|nr:DUF11 domain-containing protein [Lutibacter sp. B1]NLP57151.1 DUF11 domain-containing protein [Lutibacter sp. B1]
MKKEYVINFISKIKNIKTLLIIVVIYLFNTNITTAQCTDCTVTGPTSGDVTVPANSVMCFTSGASINNITFADNSKICIASGVTVYININTNSTTGNNIDIEVYGTLQFSNPPDFKANVDITVHEGGVLNSGKNGKSDIKFSGTGSNTLLNNGEFNVNVLTFSGSTQTNTVDNYGTMNIGSNVNLESSTTQFRNEGELYIGQSFNSNSYSSYVNCGYVNTGTSFNLQGSLVINTGTFISNGGAIDFSNSLSRFENYGEVSVGSVNLGGNGSTIYNQGLFTLSSNFQNDGNLTGPTDDTKKGYFVVGAAGAMNSGTIGPNLDFKNISVSPNTNAASVFGNNVGSLTFKTNVTYDCQAKGTCSAPQVTTGVNCPLIDGTLVTCNIEDVGLTNVTCSNNGTTGLSSDDTFTFTLNPTGTNLSPTYSITGDIERSNIPYGTPVNFGPYAILGGTINITITDAYNFCSTELSISPPGTCSVPAYTTDTDGDGITDDIDLDIDGDGIPNSQELSDCVSSADTFLETFGAGSNFGAESQILPGSTSYLYRSNIDSNNNYLEDGQYTFANSPQATHWDWQDMEDHTEGDVNGYMMVVNAAFEPGEFYRVAVDVEPNTYYEFSAWLVVVNSQETVDRYCGADLVLADAKFQVENSSGIIGSTVTGEIPFSDPAEWDKYQFTFKTGATDTSIDIVLINNAPGGCGNDLAIDDIQLTPLCDTDGDGVLNHYDLDADNDGIHDLLEAGGTDADNDGLTDNFIDVNRNGLNDAYDYECTGLITTTGYAVSSPSNSGASNPTNALGEPDNTLAVLDRGNEYVVLELQNIVPSGTVITLRHNRTNGTRATSVRVEQSLDGSSYSNAKTYSASSTTFVNSSYTLAANAKYIKITNTGGGWNPADIGIDALSYSYTVDPCDGIVGVPLTIPDTDADGLPDYLDLDSDADGCSDSNEAYVLDSSVVVGNADGNIAGTDDMYYGTSPVYENPDGSVMGASYPGTTSAVTDSSVYIACRADLELTKTVDKTTPTVGETIIFTLTLVNNGASATTLVQVKDLMPEGLMYNSEGTVVPSGTTYNSTTGVWNLGNIIVKSGNQYVLKIAAVVQPNCGDITNFAEVVNSIVIDSDSTPNNNQ